MPRLSDAVQAQITQRHRLAWDALYRHATDAGAGRWLRRLNDSLDDIPVLLAAYREALALNARYREALQWCLDEGGWRLLEYELSGPPPAGVFDRRGHFNPRLADEAVTVAALGLPGGPEPEKSSEGGD
jgi:hypothetical protein